MTAACGSGSDGAGTRPSAAPAAEIDGVRLRVAPIGLKAANAYVVKFHRHHKASHGHKFSVAVRDQHDELRGVAIASRPRASGLDDGESLEVTRVCTDGAPNACSMLYGAVRRAAIAMGYEPHRIFTYTLRTEPGTSLHAAGWHRDKETRGGEWSRKGREREPALITDPKVRWRAAPEPSYSPGTREQS